MSAPPTPPRCTCGHMWACHEPQDATTRQPARRGPCRTGTAAGSCRCTVYTPEDC